MGVTLDETLLSLEMFQTPLNVALAASPLFLLTNRTLAGLSLGKEKVFEVRPIFHCNFFIAHLLV
jgi:hypothetical protein